MEPNRVFFVSLHFSCLLWRLLCEIGSLDSLPCISLEHECVFIKWRSLSWWPPGAENRTSWEGLDSGVKCKWAMLSASAVCLSRCGAAFGFCCFIFYFYFLDSVVLVPAVCLALHLTIYAPWIPMRTRLARFSSHVLGEHVSRGAERAVKWQCLCWAPASPPSGSVIYPLPSVSWSSWGCLWLGRHTKK